MSISSIVAFWGVALLLIVVPGADWAFTISAGLRGLSVLPAVGGLVIGYAGMTIVVAAGVGALVAGSPYALTALTVVGGAYLMWFGIRTFLSPSSPVIDATDVNAGRPRSALATIGQGIGVSGLNPKGLLIFVALLPQFANPRGSVPLALQLAVLGLVFMVTVAVFYLILGSLTRTVLVARPSAARTVSRVSGIGMFLIGAFLLADRLW
jgi:threonine/homoserine/homoserine lactone efflux protein